MRKLLGTLKGNWQILLLLLFSLIIRLPFVIKKFPVWWDSALHIGVAKFFFSSGQAGILELGKPLIWPLLLGPIWKLGLNPFMVGKLLQPLFSLGSVYLVYLISKKLYNKHVALLAALMFSATPFFLKFTHVLITDIASIFFALLAIHLFIQKNSKSMFLAGLFAGIAFMTRFPQGIIIFCFGAALLFTFLYKKDFKEFRKNIFFVGSGFLIIAASFLLFNQFVIGNALIPITKAFYVFEKIKNNYLSYYFVELIKQNILFVFSIVGLFYFFRKKEWLSPNKLIIVLALFSFFSFFLFLKLKVLRYTLVALPYLAILSAYGLTILVSKIKQKRVQLAGLLAATAYLLLLSSTFSFSYTEQPLPQTQQNFLSFLEGASGGGKLLSTTPMFAVNTDKRIEPLGPWSQAKRVYAEEANNYDTIAISTCDFPCDYENCVKDKDEFLEKVSAENERAFYEKDNNCEYMVFRKATTPE
jgi:hypothetical protein